MSSRIDTFSLTLSLSLLSFATTANAKQKYIISDSANSAERLIVISKPKCYDFSRLLPARTRMGLDGRASNPEIMFREAKIFDRFFNVAFVPQSLLLFPARLIFRPASLSDAGVGHRSYYCSWPQDVRLITSLSGPTQ